MKKIPQLSEAYSQILGLLAAEEAAYLEAHQDYAYAVLAYLVVSGNKQQVINIVGGHAQTRLFLDLIGCVHEMWTSGSLKQESMAHVIHNALRLQAAKGCGAQNTNWVELVGLMLP